jgi:signal transduction histidine kinase
LINDILDLAKVEAGKIDLRPTRVSVAPLVEEVRATVNGLAAERHIEIDTDVSPEVGELVVDPGRLKQVLYNYLSNALKFSPEGGRVSIRLRPEAGDAVRIEVTDAGIGIKPEDEQRLFTRFEQLDNGSDKRFGGTGLGLALTKQIVEAQGGTVGVKSVFGEGSTFFATLPRVAVATSAEVGTRL